MAKNSVSDWSTTAGSNTDVGGINIAENCPAANINNAIRTVMAQIAALYPDLLQSGGLGSTVQGWDQALQDIADELTGVVENMLQAMGGGPAPSAGNILATGASGLSTGWHLYNTGAGSSAGPSGSTLGAVYAFKGAADGNSALLFVSIAGGSTAGRMYFAYRPSTSWSSWINLYTTADLSSQAQAEAGTDNTTLMTPLRVDQAIEAKTGVSGLLSPGAGGLATFAHGLGQIPDIVKVEMVNVTPESGYSSGDRIEVPATVNDSASSSGISLRKDATNVYLRIGSGGAGTYLDKDGTARSTLTPGNWQFVIRAFRFS